MVIILLLIPYYYIIFNYYLINEVILTFYPKELFYRYIPSIRVLVLGHLLG